MTRGPRFRRPWRTPAHARSGAPEQWLERRLAAFESARAGGRIVFDEVSFSDAAGRRLLRRTSLVVEPGEHVALVPVVAVDATGLGALLAGFGAVAGGRVTIDGHDARDLRLDAVRGGLGILSADTVIQPGRLAAQVSAGRPASRAAIAEAATAVGLDAVARRLPSGYRSLVGPAAVELGPEERQRIGIARALLSDPRVVVLEDPTRILAPDAEARLLPALRMLVRPRTTLTVSRSLPLALHADRVLVLHEGRVVQEGRPTDLVVEPGPFARLGAPDLGLATLDDLDGLADPGPPRRRRRFGR